MLDPDFAAVAKTDVYRVFVMPEGDCKGLYVTTKTPTGFEVRELQGGTSTIPFSYRVVARRKDIAGPRLEKVDLRPQSPPDSQPSPIPTSNVTPSPASATPTPSATNPPVTVPPSPTLSPVATPAPSATSAPTLAPTPTTLPSRTTTPVGGTSPAF